MKKQVVEEWFERGKHDLEVARFLLTEEEYSDVVLFHIHQAVEKYLTGCPKSIEYIFLGYCN
jgi:HEPN domain-containing protein